MQYDGGAAWIQLVSLDLKDECSVIVLRMRGGSSQAHSSPESFVVPCACHVACRSRGLRAFVLRRVHRPRNGSSECGGAGTDGRRALGLWGAGWGSRRLIDNTCIGVRGLCGAVTQLCAAPARCGRLLCRHGSPYVWCQGAYHECVNTVSPCRRAGWCDHTAREKGWHIVAMYGDRGWHNGA